MTSLVEYKTESLQTTELSHLTRLADAFIADQRVAETSRKTYKWGIMLFFKWIIAEGLKMEAITLADINRYEDNLRRKKYADRTVRSYITVIKLFYEWTERNGLYPNIARYIKVRGSNKKFSRQHLTEEQGKMLLSAAKEGSQHLRNFAILNLILYTGLRTIEIRRARIEDIDYYMGKRILRVRGKGKGENNNEDFVVLIDDAYLPIKEYLDTERKNALKGEPLFTTNGNKSNGKAMSTRTIQAICKENLRKINLDSHSFTAHSLRHTTAMQLLHNGGNLYDVQRVLRHASIDTTMIYEESYRDEKHIEDSPEKMIAGIFSIEDASENN